jgi:phenylacetate-CoA ligase
MNRYLAALYGAAPIWAQNLMLTGFSAALDQERHGGRYAEFCDLLARTEWLSTAELEAYQDERLRELVAEAYENVPYYRRVFDEHKLKPSDIRGRDDLPKVPLLTRKHIKKNFEELRSRNVSARALRTGHTSGTTGTPLTVGYDHETVWMTYAVFDRHYRWAGCRLGREGTRVAVARGNVIVPLAQRRPPFWRLNRQHHQLLLSAFHMSKVNLPAYFEALARFQAEVLDGYPSTLYLLAKFLQAEGRTFPLRAAITSSETLYDFQRQVIEDRFACRVFDYYALAERVAFSHECERHQGHHLAMEYGFTEIVEKDGTARPRGSTGKLVSTSLHNKAMPLIRYVTNDVSSLRTESCACGRGLELMDDVTTKAEDVLTLKDGRLISPSVLTHPFKPLDCIEGSQIVQTAPDSVTVRIVAGPGYTDAHSLHLTTELQSRLGQDVQIDVRVVDQLEHSPNGKFKWVISHVPLGI